MNEDLEFDIEARLRDIDDHGAYRHYKPLTQAVDEFVRFAENPHLRVFTGVPEFDAEMRGVAPKELCIIGGFAHNGKTILATELLLNNADKPLVVFSPDESRTAVLIKLTAADVGVGAEEMERRIYRRDETARQQLMSVAEKYHKLVVYDGKITLHHMDIMLKEATRALGEKPMAFVFDYVGQLADDMDTMSKIDALNFWTKENDMAGFVLHQSSRSSGSGGREFTIDSGAYGGETQATFMIGVRRKINMYAAQITELEQRIETISNTKKIQEYEDRIYEIKHSLIPRHRDTISIGLVKNKRPPMRLVPELDFKLDQETGRIVKIEKDHPDDEPDMPLPITYKTASSARELLSIRSE